MVLQRITACDHGDEELFATQRQICRELLFCRGADCGAIDNVGDKCNARPFHASELNDVMRVIRADRDKGVCSADEASFKLDIEAAGKWLRGRMHAMERVDPT